MRTYLSGCDARRRSPVERSTAEPVVPGACSIIARTSMIPKTQTEDEVQTAQRYFGSFADDYHRAFDGGGANPLHHAINRLFRRKTFVRRTERIQELLDEYGVGGKTVLDLGCGSGEVSIVAARLGATVIGLDIVEDMIGIARAEAAKAGVG